MHVPSSIESPTVLSWLADDEPLRRTDSSLGASRLDHGRQQYDYGYPCRRSRQGSAFREHLDENDNAGGGRVDPLNQSTTATRTSDTCSPRTAAVRSESFQGWNFQQAIARQQRQRPPDSPTRPQSMTTTTTTTTVAMAMPAIASRDLLISPKTKTTRTAAAAGTHGSFASPPLSHREGHLPLFTTIPQPQPQQLRPFPSRSQGPSAEPRSIFNFDSDSSSDDGDDGSDDDGDGVAQPRRLFSFRRGSSVDGSPRPRHRQIVVAKTWRRKDSSGGGSGGGANPRRSLLMAWRRAAAVGSATTTTTTMVTNPASPPRPASATLTQPQPQPKSHSHSHSHSQPHFQPHHSSPTPSAGSHSVRFSSTPPSLSSSSSSSTSSTSTPSRHTPSTSVDSLPSCLFVPRGGGAPLPPLPSQSIDAAVRDEGRKSLIAPWLVHEGQQQQQRQGREKWGSGGSGGGSGGSVVALERDRDDDVATDTAVNAATSHRRMASAPVTSQQRPVKLDWDPQRRPRLTHGAPHVPRSGGSTNKNSNESNHDGSHLSAFALGQRQSDASDASLLNHSFVALQRAIAAARIDDQHGRVQAKMSSTVPLGYVTPPLDIPAKRGKARGQGSHCSHSSAR